MKLFGRYIYRTKFGFARILQEHAPDGSPVRVLKLGGVFQSATYTDERRFEPVFEYYRAFDTVLGRPAGVALEDDSLDGLPPCDASAPFADIAHFSADAHSFGTTHSFDTAARSLVAETPDAPNCERKNLASSRRVLVLGGGGFAWPKHVLATHPEARLDVVEIDPAIIRIARRHFFLDEAIERFDPAHVRLRLICDDGRAFLENAMEGSQRSYGVSPEETRYDAIVNDAFSGAEPVRSLSTVEAAQASKACLAPGGLYAANVVSDFDRANVAFLRDLTATLAEAFAHVHIIPCPDEDFGGEDNYLVIATDGVYDFEGAIPFDEDFLGTPMRD